MAVIGAVAVLGVAAWTAGPPRSLAAALVLALAGAAWGGMRLDALDRSPLASDVARAGRATIVVTGPARRSLFAQRIPAEVQRFRGRALREPVLLELPLGRSPPQGSVLDLVGEVRSPRPAQNGFDEGAYLGRRGIQVVIRASAWEQIGRRRGALGLADRLRHRLAHTMAPGLGGDRRAVVAGVVLGEDEGLSDGLADAFRASGLYHLLAVSGQNVALVGGGMVVLLWLVGVSRWVGQAVAIAAIAAYVAVVGWQPSVVRAGVAGVLASLAWLAARPAERWYFLLAGGAALLAWNPYSLFDPGFQLSFGAVAAIFVVVPRVRRRLDGYPMPPFARDAIAVSAACGVATAPLLLWHFDAVPVYAVLSNVLAAPAVAPLLGLALVTAAVEPIAPSFALLLGYVQGLLAAYLIGVARFVAALPFAQVGTRSALVLAAIGVALVLVARCRRGAAVALAAAAVVLIVGWRHWTRDTWPPPPRDGLRITALDVGQGDAILLQVPEGAVLVDEGPPEARVATQLQRLGVRRLALLVLSHPQRDHVGGAAGVLRALPVGAILDPRLTAVSPDEESALEEARQRHVPVRAARADTTYRLGRLRLRVLWPRAPGMRVADANDGAVVLLASFGHVDALLTADAESNVTLSLRPPPVEILKVAHHGSADEGLDRLLSATRPRVALISVGARNDYGHPTPSTLRSLAAAPGLAVYRTDQDGRVAVDSDGERLWIRTERE
ncbi:MAG: ComEC/Rec2 family competence protein [Gaiellaceae bacterium]